jgi:biotin-dependent carboxylase-like uncharacterized protein
MSEARSQPAIEVLEPGLLLTVQDLGRHGHEDRGVPPAGAADPRSLRLANQLVGNDEGAAALEATLLGPSLRALRDLRIAIAGADLAAVRVRDGRALGPGLPHDLAAGDVVELTEAGDPERGCRAYLAIAGGIDVPVILGSRSTSLVGAFGGFEGRPLRAGDIVSAFSAAPGGTSGAAPHTEAPGPVTSEEPIRILRGPASAEAGGAGRLDRLLATTWAVSLSSDRRGLRLEAGEPIDVPADAGDRPSHGVVPGTIQLPPSGLPLVLMPDAGVTGGYPVLAIVAVDDLWRLGQLAPESEVRFALAPDPRNRART